MILNSSLVYILIKFTRVCMAVANDRIAELERQLREALALLEVHDCEFSPVYSHLNYIWREIRPLVAEVTLNNR